jgi:hypothetical protein
MDDEIVQTVMHEHEGRTVWTDDEMIDHVKALHDVDDKPWLIAEPHSAANIDYLIRLHQKAHRDDSISFEGMIKPDWA